MSRELDVLLEGNLAGNLSMDRHGALTFEYTDQYMKNPDTTPLSISIPKPIKRHTDKKIRPWLRGLLPDNPEILKRWAQIFQVSAQSPFAILEHVGSDVAGAVRFLRASETGEPKSGYQAISASEMEKTVNELAATPTQWTAGYAVGYFSLAGAQAKIALHRTANGWSKPYGNAPSTHILKPTIPNLAHQVIGEHLSLSAGLLVGLDVARSGIEHIGQHTVLVIERYDRTLIAGELRRIHQEDLCQALGLPPESKYQVNSGPSPEIISKLLRKELPIDKQEDAVRDFISALAYAWAIGNTDAHAKNYSLLLSGSQVRLAPLYDLNTTLPYIVPERRNVPEGSISRYNAEMAMSIDKEKRMYEIAGKDWRQLAVQMRIEADELISIVDDVLKRTPSAWQQAVSSLTNANKAETIWAEKTTKLISSHCSLMRGSLTRTTRTRH